MIDDPKNSESFIVFPIEGLHTFAAVTYTLDFITGKVNIPGAADLSLSGRLNQDEVLRSVIFYANQILNIELLLNDDLQFKGPMPTGWGCLFELDHKSFNLMRISPTLTKAISGSIYTSTNKRAFGKNALNFNWLP